MARASSAERKRPRPVPSARVVKNGSKSRSTRPFGTPGPVSATWMSASPEDGCWTAIVIGHIRASDHYWSFLRRPGARRVVLENLREGVSVMFGLGSQELLVILVIVLVLFGANRLPQLARSLGSSLSALATD